MQDLPSAAGDRPGAQLEYPAQRVLPKSAQSRSDVRCFTRVNVRARARAECIRIKLRHFACGANDSNKFRRRDSRLDRKCARMHTRVLYACYTHTDKYRGLPPVCSTIASAGDPRLFSNLFKVDPSSALSLFILSRFAIVFVAHYCQFYYTMFWTFRRFFKLS